MSQDWEWVSWKNHGWESVLAGSDAPYDRLLQTRAHAAIRKTVDGENRQKYSDIRHEEDPQHASDLAAIEDRLPGYDACFFCLGVSSVGMKEETYRRVTYDLTVSSPLPRYNGD